MLPMRIGVSLRSSYHLVEPRVAVRRMVERTRAARAAGLDSLFVGDHHVTGSTYLQNVPILGRLLAEWGDKTAGALFLLPLWHPVLVAEQVGTLAAVGRGPFVMQVGLGDGDAQFAGMGASLGRRVGDLEASLEMIRLLLAGETVTADRPVSVREAVAGPFPPSRVDVWIGASADKGIDRAARLGDGWIAAPWVTPDQAKTQADRYRQRRAAAVKPVGVVAIRRDIHVGADAADAHRVADPVLAAGYRGLPPDSPVVGGPEEVAAEFVRLGELGYTDILIRHLADDHGEVLASFERLAKVRELVQQAGSSS